MPTWPKLRPPPRPGSTTVGLGWTTPLPDPAPGIASLTSLNGVFGKAVLASHPRPRARTRESSSSKGMREEQRALIKSLFKPDQWESLSKMCKRKLHDADLDRKQLSPTAFCFIILNTCFRFWMVLTGFINRYHMCSKKNLYNMDKRKQNNYTYKSRNTDIPNNNNSRFCLPTWPKLRVDTRPIPPLPQFGTSKGNFVPQTPRSF